ncbi:YjbH domain-containing protein [Acidaminococcus intestini]|nr:YjbH domain-containing protein [Acidaminococcus intestini]
MKKTVATLAILTLASAMPLAAEAKITPNGTSGIINTPSAFVRLPGHVSVGYDMTKDGQILHGNVALPLGLEVAGARFDPKDSDIYSTVSAKWELLRETPVTPAIAIGGDDLGDEKDRRGYVVVSKALPFGFKIHGGIGTDQYKRDLVPLKRTSSSEASPLPLWGNMTAAISTMAHPFPLLNLRRLKLAIGPIIFMGASTLLSNS